MRALFIALSLLLLVAAVGWSQHWQITDASWLTFDQVRIASGCVDEYGIIDEWEYLGAGLVTVDVRGILGQTGDSASLAYMNIWTAYGWVVRNLLLDPGMPMDDGTNLSVSAAFFLSDAGPSRVDSLDASVWISRVPMTASQEGGLTTFTVGEVARDARGVVPLGVPFGATRMMPAPCPPQPLPFVENSPTSLCWQLFHSNIQAATNQCAPAAIANSLDWLRLTYGIRMANPHRVGLGNDGSLVGVIEILMGRTSRSRCDGDTVGYSDMLDGKLCYIGYLGLPLVVKHQGQLGAANYTRCGVTSTGMGAVVTAQFLIDEVCANEDVELVYDWGCGAHAVVVIGAGYVLGVPWVAYRSDTMQCDDTRGTGTTEFSYLVDTDGDGRLNLVDEVSCPNATFVTTESPTPDL